MHPRFLIRWMCACLTVAIYVWAVFTAVNFGNGDTWPILAICLCLIFVVAAGNNMKPSETRWRWHFSALACACVALAAASTLVHSNRGFWVVGGKVRNASTVVSPFSTDVHKISLHIHDTRYCYRHQKEDGTTYLAKISYFLEADPESIPKRITNPDTETERVFEEMAHLAFRSIGKDLEPGQTGALSCTVGFRAPSGLRYSGEVHLSDIRRVVDLTQ